MRFSSAITLFTSAVSRGTRTLWNIATRVRDRRLEWRAAGSFLSPVTCHLSRLSYYMSWINSAFRVSGEWDTQRRALTCCLSSRATLMPTCGRERLKLEVAGFTSPLGASIVACCWRY